MGQVIQLRKNEARATPGRVGKRKTQPKTLGLIQMRITDEGSVFSVEGLYAERLQFAGYTLVKALNEITERICEAGTAGFTKSGPIKMDLNKPCILEQDSYCLPFPDEGLRK
jgi:hypothetical protein